MAYPNAVFSTFSFIGFILSLIPLYWHLEGNIRSSSMVPQLIEYSPASSSECWHYLVYGLGWPRLFEYLHQLGRLERHSGERGPGLV
jgi:hypothetical protein